MRLWIDIHDAAGNRLGEGPITTALNASVTRKLDGAGTVRFEVPLTDDRALSLIASKRRARVFVESDNVLREMGRGIIEKIGTKDSASGWRLTADGPDSLEELKFSSVLLGRKYDNIAVEQVVDDLLGLTPGWLRAGANTLNISARYDGASVLKALQSLVSQQGIHFRSSNPGTLEIGAFGVDNGLRIVNAAYAPNDIYDNDDILLIENFSLVEDSEDLVNWLLPLGAGRGDAALTLEKSTRSTAGGFAYDIQSLTGPDGRTLYYLEDATSQISFGQIQKVGTFKDIAPIGNGEDAQIAAANALYDAAAAWLIRYKDPYESYSVTVRKVRTNLQPGDKIHLRYKGLITNKDGVVVTYRDINADFWILEVRESFGLDGASVTLKIASVDRYAMDVARVVLGALEEIRINNVSVEPYFTGFSYSYTRDLDDTHEADVPIYITNAVQRCNRALVRLKSRPFRSNAKGAASNTSSSGGGSTSGSGGGSTETSTQTGLSSGLMIPVGADHRHDIAPHSHNVTIPSHTHSTPNHSHSIPAGNLTYGIYDDSLYPDTIRLEINGTDYTSALGGPWGVGGTPVDVEIEITDQLNDQPILQQEHTLTFSCDSSQGSLEVIIELYLTIQSISVFS